MIVMILSACGKADDITAEHHEPPTMLTDGPTQTEEQHPPIDLSALLTTGMWSSAADNLYYDFDVNGTGRILNPADFDASGTFTYSVNNDAVVLETQPNAQEIWTFTQDMNTFICQSAGQKKTVTQTAVHDVYTKWADNIARFADADSEQWMPQLEMNQGSYQIYQHWDQLLNEVYQYLKRVLPNAEFQTLQTEEKVWIVQKEAAVQAAGAEYEGGSMQPLILSSTAAQWTEDRVRSLIGRIPTEALFPTD